MLLAVEELKTLIGVTSGQEDARLGALLAAADSWVKSYTGRGLERSRRVEFYSGTNTQALVLRDRPVWQVYEVRLDYEGHFGEAANRFDSTTVLAQGTDWELRLEDDGSGLSESGVLHRIRYAWPILNRVSTLGKLTPEIGPARGNVRVDYEAGYDPALSAPDPGAVPGGLKAGVAMLVAHWRRTLPFGGLVTRERLGRWEYEVTPFVKRGVPDEVYSILEPYREVWI